MKYLMLVVALCVLGACSSDMKYTDMQKAPCKGSWVTTGLTVRRDTIVITAVCVR